MGLRTVDRDDFVQNDNNLFSIWVSSIHGIIEILWSLKKICWCRPFGELS